MEVATFQAKSAQLAMKFSKVVIGGAAGDEEVEVRVTQSTSSV
jgi:hypothetical protein